jgi:hypothetical protein
VTRAAARASRSSRSRRPELCSANLSGLRLHAQAHPERAAHLIAARQQDLREAMAATLQHMGAVLSTPHQPNR